MASIEQLLFATINTQGDISELDVAAQIKAMASIYTDVDQAKLKYQLQLLPDLVKDCSPLPTTVIQLGQFLSSQPKTVMLLFSEVTKLICILLVAPATVASAERSFSGLRRIKTWLRATMSQQRLTHLALANVHKDRLMKCNMMKLAAEFSSRTEGRRLTFGTFSY